MLKASDQLTYKEIHLRKKSPIIQSPIRSKEQQLKLRGDSFLTVQNNVQLPKIHLTYFGNSKNKNSSYILRKNTDREKYSLRQREIDTNRNLSVNKNDSNESLNTSQVEKTALTHRSVRKVHKKSNISKEKRKSSVKYSRNINFIDMQKLNQKSIVLIPKMLTPR